MSSLLKKIPYLIIMLISGPLIGDPINRDHCNPLGYTTCSLPYPSDHFTVNSPVTSTGKQLNLREEIFSDQLVGELKEQLQDQLQNLLSINESDGFSIATPVYFEIPGRIDATKLPKDGGDMAMIFNASTGERIPAYVQVSHISNSPHLTNPNTIIEIKPLGKMEHAQTYIAILSNSLKDDEGNSIKKSNGIQNLLRDADFRSSLSSTKVDPGKILAITRFTTRSQLNAVNKMISLSKYVYDQDHPVRKIKLRKHIFGPIAYTMKGEVKTNYYLNEKGHFNIGTPKTESKTMWIPFVMHFPKLKDTEKLEGLAIYGHGLLTGKWEAKFAASKRNAKFNIATIAIDHAFHGPRRKIEPFSIFSWFLKKRHHVEGFPLHLSMASQSILDQLSLLKAVRNHIPKYNFTPRFIEKYNLATLENIPVLYQSTSYGGVFVGVFAAIAPKIDAALFRVSAANISMITSYSKALKVSKIGGLSKHVPGGELSTLMALTQQYYDSIELMNYLSFFREGNKSLEIDPRGVTLTYSIKDGIVAPEATEALIHGLNLTPFNESKHTLSASSFHYLPMESKCYISRLLFLGNVCHHAAPLLFKSTKLFEEDWVKQTMTSLQ